MLTVWFILALWIRLKERPKFPLELDDNSKSYIYNNIREISELSAYTLPTPRCPLVIYNRFNYVDEKLGIIVEPVSDNINPTCRPSL